MLGYLAGRFPPQLSIAHWQLISPLIAFALLVTALFYLYKDHSRTLKGGNDSLVYSTKFAKKTEAKFIQEFSFAVGV